jgi:hypothetical protein
MGFKIINTWEKFLPNTEKLKYKHINVDSYSVNSHGNWQHQHPKHCFQMYFKWWGEPYLFFPKEFCTTTEVYESLVPGRLGDRSLCGSADIFVFPVYLLVLVTILACVILRWPLDFWKVYFIPSYCSFAQHAMIIGWVIAAFFLLLKSLLTLK